MKLRFLPALFLLILLSSTLSAQSLTVTPFPADGAVDVLVTGIDYNLLFSNTLDSTTVTDSNIFMTDSGDNAVAVDLVIGGGGSPFVFLVPFEFLIPGETYTMHATTAVTDVSGNSLASEFTSSFTTAIVLPLVLNVPLDIKPGSDPNSINCNNHNGVIPVAILTTEDFDATTVDHTTVTFEGGSETHVNRTSGEPRRHEEDVDDDGDTDLVFHFRLLNTNLTCDSTEGTLTGETFDGMAIEGVDSVRVVGGVTVITVGQPIP